MKEFTLQGLWWSDLDSERIPGNIVINQDKSPQVDLLRRLPTKKKETDAVDFVYGQLATEVVDFVYGQLADGKKVTLITCYQIPTQISLSSAGIATQAKIYSNYCVLGAWIDESTIFTKANYDIHNMLQFAFGLGIREKTANGCHGYYYQQQTPIVHVIGEDNISIESGAMMPSDFDGHTAKIEEYCNISIEFKPAVSSVDEVLSGPIRVIKSALEFSIGYPQKYMYLKVSGISYRKHQERFDDAEIFFGQIKGNDKVCNPINDMIFSIHDQTDTEKQDFFKRWETFYVENRFSIDSIIASEPLGDGRRGYESLFINLTSALEFLCNKYIPKKDIPKKSSKNPDLQDKLNALFREIESVFPMQEEPIIADKYGLSKNIKDFRTRIAHHEKKGTSQLDNPLFAFRLTKVAWALTVIYCLIKLNFRAEQILMIIKGKISMLNALHWLDEVSKKDG